MPNSIVFGVYCEPNTVALLLSADKHQAGGVDQVCQVEDEVNSSEHGHSHHLIPSTHPQSATTTWRPLFRSAMLGVKVEDWPDNRCWQIEDHSQHGIGRQEAGEREGEATGALANTEHDDAGWQDEADAVDRHAILQCIMAVIQWGVADEDKNDAGHEGLTNFHQARSCGHVAGHLAWTRLADAHLAHVGNGCQAGEDGWDNTVVAYCALAIGVLEVEDGKNDGGWKAEQGGVAGKGDGEVLPRNRGSGLKAKQLHQDNKQSPSETEGPAEDAPITSSMGESATVYSHGEGHAGENQGCQPCP